ncbi:MAG TPA: hypothetical protein VHS06_00665 [Chloroflexota bacterium]|nr:hypothetical protein [Chloroflexota bacterium]
MRRRSLTFLGDALGWEPLWSYLLALSLLLLPIEVGLRRIRTLPFTRHPNDDS